MLQVDNRLEKFLSRLNLKNENNTEYWRKRFLGENTEEEEIGDTDIGEDDSENTAGNAEGSGENKEDGDGEEEVEVEVEEEADDLEDGGAEEEVEPRVMLAQQLLESDEALEMQVHLFVHFC